jgi:hypothetical protein
LKNRKKQSNPEEKIAVSRNPPYITFEDIKRDLDDVVPVQIKN